MAKSNPSLRERIISYMRTTHANEAKHHLPPAGIPTWWFKFHIEPLTTAQIRAELMKMEKEGLVQADRSQSNNTMWKLLEVAHDDR